MIWHLAEVWALLAGMFLVGCLLGAGLYSLIARSALASAQGALADVVGDLIERIKVRIGLAPAWRRERLRRMERVRRQAQERVEPRFSTGADEVGTVRTGNGGFADAVPAMSTALDGVVPSSEITGQPGISPADATPASRAESAMRIGADGLIPKRPPGLSGPRAGAPDNLQRIKGIGRRNEALLNSLGIYHFSQIAAWTPAEIRWIGQYLAYPERIEEDDWPSQATLLAMGHDTGFEKSADRRRRRRREQREFAARMANASEADALAALIGPPRLEDVVPPEPADDPYATVGDDLADYLENSYASVLEEALDGVEGSSPYVASEVPEVQAEAREVVSELAANEQAPKAKRKRRVRRQKRPTNRPD